MPSSTQSVGDPDDVTPSQSQLPGASTAALSTVEFTGEPSKQVLQNSKFLHISFSHYDSI